MYIFTNLSIIPTSEERDSPLLTHLREILSLSMAAPELRPVREAMGVAGFSVRSSAHYTDKFLFHGSLSDVRRCN
jgi:hypothetical protein